eukprot:5813330-Pyramimonas_sp.AAC.2
MRMHEDRRSTEKDEGRREAARACFLRNPPSGPQASSARRREERKGPFNVQWRPHSLNLLPAPRSQSNPSCVEVKVSTLSLCPFPPAPGAIWSKRRSEVGGRP